MTLAPTLLGALVVAVVAQLAQRASTEHSTARTSSWRTLACPEARWARELVSVAGRALRSLRLDEAVAQRSGRTRVPPADRRTRGKATRSRAKEPDPPLSRASARLRDRPPTATPNSHARRQSATLSADLLPTRRRGRGVDHRLAHPSRPSTTTRAEHRVRRGPGARARPWATTREGSRRRVDAPVPQTGVHSRSPVVVRDRRALARGWQRGAPRRFAAPTASGRAQALGVGCAAAVTGGPAGAGEATCLATTRPGFSRRGQERGPGVRRSLPPPQDSETGGNSSDSARSRRPQPCDLLSHPSRPAHSRVSEDHGTLPRALSARPRPPRRRPRTRR